MNFTGLSALALCASFGWPTVARFMEERGEHASTPAPARSEVDLAICLDTSGSMQGLIEATKQKLWAIVNDFALAKPMPKLRVALLSFGNDGYSPENGWVEVLAPFTEDLDLVSQRLFALTTNGGTELVGRVVDKAARDLAWTAAPGALKVIVVAGNESADQDSQVSYRDASAGAIARDVLVNAIYCGNPADELAPAWREVARLADGQFAAIDHDEGTVVIATPFDAELARLSSDLNATYVPLGSAGEVGCSNQAAQDANAAGLNSEAAAVRAQTKANGLYVCNWDLVTACKEKQVELAQVKEEELPEAMRSMSLEERQHYLDEKAAERARVQERVQVLGAQRDAFVLEESKRQALDPSRSFDFALRSAMRAQAEARGMRFEESAAPAAPMLGPVIRQAAPQGAPGAASQTPAAAPPAPETAVAGDC